LAAQTRRAQDGRHSFASLTRATRVASWPTASEPPLAVKSIVVVKVTLPFVSSD